MSRKSILLLHGALGSAKQFNQLTKALSSSFDVYSFSFEGHGGVESNRPFAMNHFMENTIDYMEEHHIESSSIFGYSMGGYVALTMASKHPEKVEKIITLGTKFDWTPEFAASEVRKLNPEKIEEKVPRFAEHLKRTHEPLDWKEVVRDTANMMRGLGENNPLAHNYSTISAPTLIALGSLDSMSSEVESRDVAEQLSQGNFKLIPNLEHPIEKADANELAQLIERFIED